MVLNCWVCFRVNRLKCVSGHDRQRTPGGGVLIILAASRSGEVRGARWNEIDLNHAVWTIPAERMKAYREHRVPLSEPAMAVLRAMAQFGTKGFVFPGLKDGSALS